MREAQKLVKVGSLDFSGISTTAGDRAQILKDFRERKIQFVVNVGVLTEGFGDAGVEVVVMARSTKSRALYAQMAGRATRPAAEIASKLGQVSDEVAVGSRSRTKVMRRNASMRTLAFFVRGVGRAQMKSQWIANAKQLARPS